MSFQQLILFNIYKDNLFRLVKILLLNGNFIVCFGYLYTVTYYYDPHFLELSLAVSKDFINKSIELKINLKVIIAMETYIFVFCLRNTNQAKNGVFK